MCCSGVFWGELLCSPSAAQITWWVPVLMQGAEIRELADTGPGTGLPACTPCSFGPFPRAHLLCLSQVGIRLSCYPFHHSQRGPEPSRTPAPPPVSCSGPNALRGGAVDLQGRTLEVDVGASQALVPSGVIRAWAWGSRGNPEETEFCACTCLLFEAEHQC